MEEGNLPYFPLQLDISNFCDSQDANHFIDFSLLERLTTSCFSEKKQEIQKNQKEKTPQTNCKRKCSDLGERNVTFVHRGTHSFHEEILFYVFCNFIQQTHLQLRPFYSQIMIFERILTRHFFLTIQPDVQLFKQEAEEVSIDLEWELKNVLQNLTCDNLTLFLMSSAESRKIFTILFAFVKETKQMTLNSLTKKQFEELLFTSCPSLLNQITLQQSHLPKDLTIQGTLNF
jgi:hypothetical protein